MEVSPWKLALDRLQNVDPDLADAFDKFYQNVPLKERESLLVFIERYPYARTIVDSGQALLSNGDPFPSGFQVSKTMPFGVVLTRACEVWDRSIARFPGGPRSQTLLYKGDCIGLFELLDKYTPGAHGAEPDWNISSGSINVRCLPNISTKDRINSLRKEYGNFDTENFKRATTLAQRAVIINGFCERIDDWYVDVLYFHDRWFELAFEMTKDEKHKEYAIDLVLMLYSIGWRSESRIRDAHTTLYQYFADDLQHFAGRDLRPLELAYAFLVQIFDVLDKRRPYYILVEKDDEVAPISMLCSGIVDVAQGNEEGGQTKILRPTYMSEADPIGYVPLEHISPHVVTSLRGGSGKNVRNNVLSMFERIRNASNVASADGGKAHPLLLELSVLLGQLAFRSPVPTASAEKTNATDAFRLALDGERNRNVTLLDMPEQEFFSPFLTGLDLPRSDFFRSCVKVSMRSAE